MVPVRIKLLNVNASHELWFQSQPPRSRERPWMVTFIVSTVHLGVVGGNRACAAWGHAAYTGNLHPL